MRIPLPTIAIGVTLGAVALSAAAADQAKLRDDSYGHHLIDAALAAHPEIAVMAMHVTPPGGTANVIVASNIGRLGKRADADDLAVLKNGIPRVSLNAAGDRLEVLEPLKDVSGDPIGVLGVVFHYKPGDAKEARRAEALAIGDRLAKLIAHAGNLLDPWPYDPHFSDRTYAQTLVDRTLAAHPEVLILAIHATPPGSAADVILGSNIGRIGKAADDDDLRVIDQGATNREVNETGRRFEAEIPLNDKSGVRIGALGVVYAYHAGDDKERLVQAADALRDGLAAQIDSPAALVQPAP